MKKVIVLLMVLLALSSSVFAKDKADQTKMTEAEKRVLVEVLNGIADSKLDLKRWEFVSVDTENNYIFIDKETIATPYSDTLEVWECYFRRAGEGSCNSKICKEKNIDTAKHYHYSRYKFDLSHLKQTVTSMSVKDESGKVVFSIDVPSYLQKDFEIFPESMGEKIMLKVKEIAQENKKKKK